MRSEGSDPSSERILIICSVLDVTPYKLLGGKESKNAPVDCGKEVWETLYAKKRKVV